MNILMELIDNSETCPEKRDCRYHILNSLADNLAEKNHNVFILNKNIRTKILNHTRYSDAMEKDIDFYFCHTPYRASKKRYQYFKNRKVNMVCYEAGWLHKSLVVDRNKFFADSYYYKTIKDLIEVDFDADKADKYRCNLLTNQKSKWKQDSIVDIPFKKYIFIPGQVLHDVSIEFYSQIGMLEFIDRVVAFANNNKLNVVYKPHPGLTKGETHGKEILKRHTERLAFKNKNFHIISTSIFDLMKNAEFTACINAGAIIDGIVSSTPVLSCGKSFFTNTGAIIYNEKLEKGLMCMLNKNYDFYLMKAQQLKVLYWLKNHLIQEELGADENLKRLEYHSGVKF